MRRRRGCRRRHVGLQVGQQVGVAAHLSQLRADALELCGARGAMARVPRVGQHLIVACEHALVRARLAARHRDRHCQLCVRVDGANDVVNRARARDGRQSVHQARQLLRLLVRVGGSLGQLTQQVQERRQRTCLLVLGAQADRRRRNDHARPCQQLLQRRHRLAHTAARQRARVQHKRRPRYSRQLRCVGRRRLEAGQHDVAARRAFMALGAATIRAPALPHLVLQQHRARRRRALVQHHVEWRLGRPGRQADAAVARRCGRRGRRPEAPLAVPKVERRLRRDNEQRPGDAQLVQQARQERNHGRTTGAAASARRKAGARTAGRLSHSPAAARAGSAPTTQPQLRSAPRHAQRRAPHCPPAHAARPPPPQPRTPRTPCRPRAACAPTWRGATPGAPAAAAPRCRPPPTSHTQSPGRTT
eukprot:353527-Chlamydomonas_euryale.AAC.1